jgi:hypothetical protein
METTNDTAAMVFIILPEDISASRQPPEYAAFKPVFIAFATMNPRFDTRI